MRIEIAPEAVEYFNELSTILYEKDYFGFEENAVKYVNDLLDDIMQTLSTRVKKLAPTYFDKYGKGMLYAVFPKNKATQWYVFFSVYQKNGETIYLIRYISNNHVSAQYL
jgi:hypothetical protein